MKRAVLAAVVAALSFVGWSSSVGEKAGLFATYAHSTSITFVGYDGESTLTDFPALIRLSDGDGGFSYQECAADGRDVRFCGADGQELDSEIVKFDKNGTSEFWVKVPRLSNKTRIFVVWGNANASDRSFGMSAWNEGFLGSWNFDAGANLLADRSPKAMHGTINEAEVDTVDGVIGKARRFKGNVKSRGWLGSGSRTDLEPNAFTAECWFKVESLPTDWSYFLCSETRGAYAIEQACVFGVNAGGYVFGRMGGTYSAGAVALSSTAAEAGSWHHAVLTYAADGTMTIYLDGEPGTAKTMNRFANWGRIAANPYVAVLDGDNGYPGKFRYYAGDLDEVRLSSVAQSADWVRASYQTVAENGTFAVFGIEASSLMVDGEAQPVSETIAAEIPAVVEENGVRKTCLGYELVSDGEVVAAGGVNTIATDWPEGAKTVAVRWLRKVEYKVNDAFVEPGSIVTLTADAAPADEAFHSWSGDCPELETFSPTFELPADKPRTVAAVYAPLTAVTAVADDSEASGAALKAAVEAAVAAGGNQVIEVGGGEYLLSAKITVTTPVVVRAKAGETPRITYTASPFAFSAAGSALIGLTMEKEAGYKGDVLKFSNGAVMLDCVLDDHSINTAYSSGSGVSMTGGWMRRSVVRNFAQHQSCGATLQETLVDSCVLTNLAGQGKSAVVCNKKTTIRNAIIARNHPHPVYNGSHNGGGLAVAAGNGGSRIENCTIADNTNWLSGNSAPGGGLYAAEPVVVVNTVFSGNQTHAVEDGEDFSGPVAAINSISKQFTAADLGCKAEEVEFFYDVEAGVSDRVTYQLAESSSARNAGSATAWTRTPGAWDLLGKGRVNEGVVDVGASEFYLVRLDNRLDIEGVPEPHCADLVSPTYGVYDYLADGQVLSLSAPAGVQMMDEENGVACTGWKLYWVDLDTHERTEIASGTTLSTNYVNTGAWQVLEWQWETRYKTSFEFSDEHGSVVAAQETVAPGGTARFAATPDEGYAVAWTGDVPNERIFGNELVLENVEGPIHVVASFFKPSENPQDAAKAGLFADYSHSTPITFAGYEGESTLTNFPALIRLGEGVGGFSYNDCAADGRDVRFCGADGQELDSEIATWDKNGTSEFWIKVPRLSKRTRIFAVWGNASAPARPFGMSAWSGDFCGSWNFDAGTNLLFDRSPKAMHGTINEAEVDTVDGVIGKARRFKGNDKSRGWLGSGSRTDLEPDEFTAECWFKVESLPSDQSYFLTSETRGYNTDGTACAIGLDSAGRVFGRVGGLNAANAVILSATDAEVGAWHHAALTCAADGTTTVYLDGVPGASKVMTRIGNWGLVAANPSVAAFEGDAGRSNKFRYYAGDLDEMRISSVAHNADWVRASYQTVAENGTFAVFDGATFSLTVGDETQLVAATVSAETPAVVEENGVKTTHVGHELVADGKLLVSNEQLAVAVNWPKGAKTVAVRWLVKVEYKVNDAFVEPGSIVTLTADAAPADEAFHSWSGDCPELETFSPSFELPADRPRTVTAVYAPLTAVTAVADDPEASGAALKAAVEAAVAAGGNQVVEVGGGEYLLSAKTSVTTPVVVRAKAGETPHITYKASPFAFSAAGSALVGLAMEKGVAFGGNILSFSNGACMLDCVLDDKSLNTGYSRAEGVSMNGGWMRRSVVRNVSRHDDRGLTLESTLVDSCVLTNLSGQGKSPIACDKKTTLRNTIIARNHPHPVYNGSHNGGGLSVAANVRGVRIENCTIADNTNWLSGNSAPGGGLYAAEPVVVVNTVFAGNAAHVTTDGDDFSGPVAAINSISKQFTAADLGCKTTAAFLEDEDGVADRVTYKPAANSPARNAGSVTSWAMTPGTWDILGQDRVAEGVVDIGAAEFYPTGREKLSVSVAADKSTGRDTLEVAFTATVLEAKGEVTYVWDFGDGTVVTNAEGAVSYTYTRPGFYTAVLTVKDESGAEARFESPDPIYVLPSVCYVNADGTHEPPYATRETGAALDIQDVLSYNPSKIVICSNSTMKGGATIGYPLTIVGEDRETSVIGDSISITDARVVLSTLTITYDAYYGYSLTVSGALLTNVVVRNVRPPNSGHGALALKDGARIVDSQIVENYVGHNNASMNGGTSAIEIVGGGVVIDGCNISSNASGTVGGVYAAGIFVAKSCDPMPVVRNSFIGYNRCFDLATKTNAVGGAGIYAEGPVRVENCTIVSNQTCGVGSAVYVKAGAAEIVNTIIASNAGGLTNAAEICSNEVYVAEGASVTWQKCRVPAEAGISGEEVTTADPKFNFGRRASVPYWGILGDSPLKNKGVKLEWMTPETKDLDGQKRVFNAKPDLGCYESQVGGTVIIVR